MPTYRAPGVYVERAVAGETRLELVRTDIAVFLGLTERGPVQQPIKISSFNEFQAAFGGSPAGGYLAYALLGFFNNGGRECYVIRILHRVATGGEPVAISAHQVIKAIQPNKTLMLKAQSEGAWGNSLSFSLSLSESVPRFRVTGGIQAGATTTVLGSTKGLSAGEQVSISSPGGQKTFAEIKSINDQQVEWKTPIEQEYPAAESIFVEPLWYDFWLRYGTQSETFRNLSFSHYHPRFLIEMVNRNSTFVTVEARDNFEPDPATHPVSPGWTGLTGGIDAIESITPEDFIGARSQIAEKSGLALIETLEDASIICLVDLVACRQKCSQFNFDTGVLAVQQAAINLCENTKNRFVILDTPAGISPLQALEYRDQFDSSFAALYYPWIFAVPLGWSGSSSPVLMPPSGHIAGIFAKSDLEYGCHRAPANEELVGVIDLERPTSAREQEILNPRQVNCLRAFPGRGIRVWGTRTTSSEIAWRYVNIRRTVSMISESIRQGTQWVVFEPNTAALWKSLTRIVSVFLRDLWKKGYLLGKTPEEAFYVKCDAETNPPETRDGGMLITEVGLAVVAPLEFIVVRIAQQTLEAGAEMTE